MTKNSGIINFITLIVISLAMMSSVNVSRAANNNAKTPAMPVDIVIIKKQAIRLWTEFSGRLAAVDYVEIRPQVTGLITAVKFKDGQFVRKGDILYIIDPRPLKAIVVQENANLVAAKNRFNLATKEHKRAKDLVRKKLISQQLLDERLNTMLIASSEVNRAEAKLSEAKIKLSYAYIKSPVSGRISRAELTEGNLVSAGPNAPLLTTVVSSANIYADFEIDEQTYSQYLSEGPSNTKSIVELRLQSSDTVYEGKIHAFDNRIDPASGTIRARAIFDNPQGRLLPGMYAHLKLASNSDKKIILLNERAIGTDQNRKFVYVVDNKNKATYREVTLGNSLDGNRVIRSGLSSGDKVIVHGLIRIRPNMLVTPVEIPKQENTAAKL